MFTKNRSKFSKLAMGPLWLEIMSNFQAMVNGSDVSTKFSLYAGHDLTLMPFLASIGLLRKEWVTYAAAVVIELHEVGTDGPKDDNIFKTNHAFRLLYNGKVMTQEIDGCPVNVELCGFEVLVNLIDSFATNYENCAVTNETPTTDLPEEEIMDEANLVPAGGVRGSASGAIEGLFPIHSIAFALSTIVLGIVWN